MNLSEIFHSSWYPIMHVLYEEPLKTLKDKILPEISYQPKSDIIFTIFKKPVNEIRVVVLGQDPYPTPNTAIGRAFAVNENNSIPFSLKNIFKEIELSTSPVISTNRNGIGGNVVLIDRTSSKYQTLQHWEEQGVFLLNTALTVQTGEAGSHLKYWSEFTKCVIRYISVKSPSIWLLWGRNANTFKKYIDNVIDVKKYDIEIDGMPITPYHNYVLSAPHPAAEAYSSKNAGFIGCKHFDITNKILKKLNKKEIIW